MMNAALTGWKDIAGRLLVIINSTPHQHHEVARLFEAIERSRSAGMAHVIATAEWRPWLMERGALEDHTLFVVDEAGKGLELNYFLESPDTLRWILSREFDLVVGSAPHSPYNEEIKDIFERRVALFLGQARFLAHALPEPHVLVMDLAHLLQRFGRAQKVAAYQASTRHLIDDLHDRWLEQGRPLRSDDETMCGERALLVKHLGGIPRAVQETPEAAADAQDASAEFVSYLEGVFHPAIGLRDGRILELVKSVGSLEDKVARLQAELDRFRTDVHRRQGEEARLQDELSRLLAEAARVQGEVDRREQMLADLQDSMTHEVDRRDQMLADLQTSMAHEVDRRDLMLADLHRSSEQEVGARDDRLREMQHESVREIARRDADIAMLARERAEAVALRDTIIDQLRNELARFTRGWRRVIVGRPRI